MADDKGQNNAVGASHVATTSAATGLGAGAALAGSAEELRWAARLVGAGSLLTLLYELAFLGFDRDRWWSYGAWPFSLHLLNVALYLIAVLMTLRVGPWLQRHWKTVAFSFSSILIASSVWLAIITREAEPLFIALVLFLAGTGPFLSWGERTQALLSLVAFCGFAIAVSQIPDASADPYQWLGIVIAAAIGLFSTALERRLHRARRRAEDEALKSREILVSQERIRVAGQLAAGIAHDLNNTLNIIKLRLAALLNDNALLQHRSAVRTVQRAVDDAALTVARVRELGRSRERNRTESSQLAQVIEEALDLVRTTVEGKFALQGASIKMESHISGPLPMVNGSASELRQVFLNLLINAYEAVDQKGEIVVDAAVRDNHVLVTLSDNGPGIPTAQLEQIFDPFFTTKGARGTGLGLAIAKDIMQSFGGRITASNRAQGGAIFALHFPIATHAAADPAENAIAPPRVCCRFLLVDDELSSLEALRDVLLLRGHSVDTAQSGSEALKKITSASVYDLILCDLAMPEMNGWEVARIALQGNPELNFYLVTGWGERMQAEIPPDLPVRGVLPKPIDLTRLERFAAIAASGTASAREARMNTKLA